MALTTLNTGHYLAFFMGAAVNGGAGSGMAPISTPRMNICTKCVILKLFSWNATSNFWMWCFCSAHYRSGSTKSSGGNREMSKSQGNESIYLKCKIEQINFLLLLPTRIRLLPRAFQTPPDQATAEDLWDGRCTPPSRRNRRRQPQESHRPEEPQIFIFT